MTTTTEDMEFDFSGATGSEAAREAFQSNQSLFNRIDFFGLDATAEGVQRGDNSAIIRLLSDDRPLPDGSLPPWITVDQHSMVATKPTPQGWPFNWPAKMGAVCRNDKVFKARYGDCCIDTMPPAPGRRNSKPSPRTWALAVLREQVIGDGTEALGGEQYRGKVVGIRDKTKEIQKTDDKGEPTGETEVVPVYVKINQGWKNFFSLLSGHAGHYGTVLDRDYWITREGMGQDNTVYVITPLDPITFAPNHPLFPGQVFDLRSKEQREHFYPNLPDLRKMVAEQASDEYYNRYFAPENALYGNGSKGEGFEQALTKAREEAANGGGSAPASKGVSVPSGAPSAPSTESAPPSIERLNALREKIGGPGFPAPAQTAAPAATAAPAEAPAPAAQPAAQEQAPEPTPAPEPQATQQTQPAATGPGLAL